MRHVTPVPRYARFALVALLLSSGALKAQLVKMGQPDSPTPSKSDAQYISSDVAACDTVREKLGKTIPAITIRGYHLRREGLLLDLNRGKTALLPYAEMKDIEASPGTLLNSYVYIHMDKKLGSYDIFYPVTPQGNEDGRILTLALKKLSADAKAGKPFLCTDDPAELTATLDEFAQKTAPWRAMNPKPADSETIHKYRLLAEDAVKHEDAAGAARYYQEGVDQEPTWAQGWFNAALIYAQLTRYSEAAFAMKHYVILMPEAPDIQGAKDNIILWEAKAQEANPVTQATPSAADCKSILTASRGCITR